MKLRPFVFWLHLIAGATAGIVILVMCVTGVLLTYERQLIAWADSGYRSVAPAPGANALSMDALLAHLRGTQPDVSPTTITVRSDAAAAVAIGAGQRTLYVDRYSGNVIGEASRGGVRTFMSDLRAWHRWLAVDGEGRPAARAVTGWSNAIFLFIVMSGIFLWFPRRWTWGSVRSVLLFNPAARGKARDFNWHNVIGSWCAVPLFIVVLSAMPISFGWFNALVYRAAGEAPPAKQTPARPAESRPREASSMPANLDALFTRAQAHVGGWRSISLRVPSSSNAPAVLTVDAGDGGQPHLRSTLALDARTGDVVRFETFSDLTPGRRIRALMRFAHTGEVFGIAGQTVAGIVSAGGAVLVWTGLALALRRFRAWLSLAPSPRSGRHVHARSGMADSASPALSARGHLRARTPTRARDKRPSHP
jgi:uncharacterized iron-regulated membrane protein